MRLLLAVILTLSLQFAWAGGFKQKDVIYQVNLMDRASDEFEVTLQLKKSLSADNNIFQFAATAPGTYQTMNIGRYVTSFAAYDKKGNLLPVDSIGINQYQLGEPELVSTISYRIKETWDTQREGPAVYRMCGTSIEEDHALINGQAVFGYLKGLQAQPFLIELNYPEAWELGTALSKNKKGYYEALSYDHIVDSPILLGELSKASTTFNETTVELYTYSKTGLISSEDLLQNMTAMLESADAFMEGMPVDRYTFLFHFEDQSWGAWEHSYSSEYVYQEAELTPEYATRITSTAAHEFFHVVTPLNIHSEIIENFNFEVPVPSQHLWLYEGVTEWASDLMQLRDSLISLQDYLGRVREKLVADEYYDPEFSLVDLALTSYTPEGQRQYGNIYQRGALVATLLDIQLLEQSNGNSGLRELINQLAQDYGPKRAFDEERFFEEVVERTYPEITDFIDAYIKNANPLPIGQYFDKLGINYQELVITENKIPTLGWELTLNEEQQIVFVKVTETAKSAGLQENDVFINYDEEAISMENIRTIYAALRQMQPGSTYSITVLRGDEELSLPMEVTNEPQQLKHQLTINTNASEKQRRLREAWLQNLSTKEQQP